MNATMSVKAAEGRKLHNPRTGAKIPHDRYVKVPKTNFWFKRVAAGDVIVENEAPAKPKAKPKSKPGDKK